MKIILLIVLLVGFQTFSLAFADPQITIDEAAGQTDPPFTINNSTSTVLFRILSDGQALIDQFVQISGSGLTQVRTYVFPDSSGTVVLEDTTQTLTSKTINADSNTISNIVNASVKDGANISLAKLETNPLPRASHTGTQTASTISDFDNQVILSRLDQMASPTSGVSLNSQKITNLGTPTNGTDATTKNYVDGVAQGLEIKASVRVATTANISLSGEQTIDGILTSANRILVKDQSTASQNGIYVTGSGAWSRSTDADVDTEVNSGMFTFVREGTVNGKKGFALVSIDPVGIGDDLIFTQTTGIPSGETNTASNIVADSATQSGLVLAKSGVDLPFKVLNEGSNISLSVDSENVTIAVTGAELSANKNIASGYAGLDGTSRIAKAQSPSDTVYTGDGQTLTMKTIDADDNTITDIDDSEIKPSAGIAWTKISKTGSSIHDIANVTSVGCAAGQVLKSSAGSWICSNDADTIVTGESTSASNTGTGELKLFHSESSNDLIFKTLTAGQGITLTNGTTTGTVATNFKVNNFSTACTGTDKVKSVTYNNSTGIFTVVCDTDAGSRTILSSDVTCTQITPNYCTVFTVPLTASKHQFVDFDIMGETNTAGAALQFRGRISTAGQTGYCLFNSPTTATAATFDQISVGTAPADTAETNILGANLPVPYRMYCAIDATATPGNLVLELQNEIASTTTVRSGSSYIKTVAP